ncbi:hypothetical protein DM01DRAFT_206171 [Hesseltinella vesiculosa]|uniref:RING-type domain-containing protein n=1 Tax=Hesseltinella vesiculosa TaxID=101127 RepID=A0A1X2G902_9FUNG|nr:hypothetical protein DM01DRAFT_206171 [Hesseltinella vesiculosa]
MNLSMCLDKSKSRTTSRNSKRVQSAQATFAKMMLAARQQSAAPAPINNDKPACHQCSRLMNDMGSRCPFCEHKFCHECLQPCLSCNGLYCSACSIMDYSTPVERSQCITCMFP